MMTVSTRRDVWMPLAFLNAGAVYLYPLPPLGNKYKSIFFVHDLPWHIILFIMLYFRVPAACRNLGRATGSHQRTERPSGVGSYRIKARVYGHGQGRLFSALRIFPIHRLELAWVDRRSKDKWYVSCCVGFTRDGEPIYIFCGIPFAHPQDVPGSRRKR